MANEHFAKSQWIYFAFVMISNYINGALTSLPGPFFPAEAETKGLTASVYGSVMGFSKFVAFIVVPILGVNMKLLGLRQCYIFGIYLSSSAAILFSLVHFIYNYTGFIFASCFFRLLDGLGICFLVTIYVIVTSVFPSRVSTVIGFAESAFILGVATGPVIGSYIFEAWGFTGVFLTFGLIQVLIATSALIFLPRLSKSATEHILPPKEALVGFLKILTVPGVIVFLITNTVTGMGSDFISTVLEPTTRQFKLTSLGIGLTFAIPGAMQLLDPLWGHILHIVKRKELVGICGSLLCAMGALMIGPASFLPVTPTITLTRVGLVFFGLGQGALMITNFTKLVEESQNSRVIEFMTGLIAVSVYYQDTTSLGGFIGSSVSGVLYTNYGPRKSFIYLFTVYGLVFILLIGFLIRRIRAGNGVTGNLESRRSIVGDEDEAEREPILNAGGF